MIFEGNCVAFFFCFYPNYFFPDIIQQIAEILPVGVAFSYMRESLSNKPKIITSLLVFVYIFMFAYLIVDVKKYRIEGDAK